MKTNIIKTSIIGFVSLWSLGIKAQAPIPYEFSTQDWTSEVEGNVEKDSENNRFTSRAEGTCNVGMRYETTRSLYITPEHKYFVVRGTGLSTADGQAYLWWLNGYNHGSQTAPSAIYEENGETVFVWIISESGLSNNISSTDNTVLMTTGAYRNTCFGMTKAEGAEQAVITYIGFTTTASVFDPIPYEFSVNDWVSNDEGYVIANVDNNTFTSEQTGNCAVGLRYQTDRRMYITPQQCYFVIRGTGFSTANGDSYLWWLNNANHYNSTPPSAVYEEGGEIVFVWYIPESGVSDNISTTENTTLFTRSSGNIITCFGLTKASDASQAVITYIGFESTNAQLDPIPYEFSVNDWVSNDEGHVIANTDNNTFTSSWKGTNAAGLNYRTNRRMYITPEQCYFVIRGTGLSTADGQSFLWWLNGVNHGNNTPPTKIYEQDGETVIAWYIPESGVADNISTTENTTLRTTGSAFNTIFGITVDDAAEQAVITYIGFEETIPAELDENAMILLPARKGYNLTVHRTLKAGNWSTFCLPFTMDVPAGWTAKKLTGSSVNGETLSLTFSEVTSFEAGTPYMVKTTDDVTSFTAKGVDITVTEASSSTTADVEFRGTLIKTVIPTGSIFIQKNLFWFAESDIEMKGMRGYLMPTVSGVKVINFDLDEGEATAIEGVDDVQSTIDDKAIYDLTGRRISTLNLPNGLYIINGKKVLVK